MFPERLIHQMKPTDILDNSPQAYRYEQNVKQLCTIAVENNLFCIQPNNRELMNVFTGQLATHEQIIILTNWETSVSKLCEILHITAS